jgi:transposase
LGEGTSYRDIEDQLGTPASTISRWKRRYQEEGLLGLASIHPGQDAQKLTPELRARVIERTGQAPPDGSARWTLRKMAAVMNVSKNLIARIWKEADLAPESQSTAANDPRFERKAIAVIGLYLDPRQNAAVFCVDHESALPALDSLDHRLPLSPGRAERQDFEDYRQGALSLLAALNPQNGEVIVQAEARHTKRGLVAFLKEVLATQSAQREVHVILDNLRSEKTGLLQRLFRQHPNVRLHSTPDYPAWLNQVETWLRRLQHDVIDTDLWTSGAEGKRKIMRYLRLYSKTAKHFQWKY